MFNKLKKSFKNPQKALKYILVFSKSFFGSKKDVLFFLGMDKGGEFDLIFRQYKKCYGFEPNPDRYNKLVKKYRNKKNVHLYNVAIASKSGEIDFHISSNNGASSSIGTFKDEWQKLYSDEIKMIKSIKVKCINIFDFCRENSIEFIDDYLSDIQGMDLEVLKTMQPMIEYGKIKTIKCEVTKDGKENVYKDLPDNTESGFNNLLNKNYKLIAKGKGLLSDNKFENIPENVWEMDCKWQIKY